MKRPLDGIRILEWATWHQGAAGAGFMLGDLGAEVIKIEQPGSGDPLRGVKEMMGVGAVLPGDISLFFELSNRNKKSIVVDLDKPTGREIVYRLVSRCDVFATNFRSGIAQRLGMDYQTLSQYNPKLIYAGSSGYGKRGPDRERRAYDWIGQAHSGFMFSVGERDMPPLSAVGMIADQMGAVMAAFAIVSALMARDRLGVGQEIHTSMLGSMMWLQYINLSAALLRGRAMRRPYRSKTPNPLINHYRCADGKWLMLCHPQADRFWGELCRALGRPDLAQNPKFINMERRRENREETIALLDSLFAARSRQEWLETFKDYDLVYSPVNEIDDLLTDPQVLENDLVTDFEHPALGKIKLAALPVEFSQTPAAITGPAPQFGQHTEEVLRELGGYSWEDIAALREQGAI